MKIRIAYVRVFVSDLQKALDFYIRAFQLEAAFVDEEMGWAQLKTEGAVLALETVKLEDLQSQSLIGRYLGITLTVDDDLETLYQRLKSDGVEFSGEPQRMPWGGLLTQMSDPDGNVLTLMESPEVSRWRLTRSDDEDGESQVDNRLG